MISIFRGAICCTLTRPFPCCFLPNHPPAETYLLWFLQTTTNNCYGRSGTGVYWGKKLWISWWSWMGNRTEVFPCKRWLGKWRFWEAPISILDLIFAKITLEEFSCCMQFVSVSQFSNISANLHIFWLNICAHGSQGQLELVLQVKSLIS